MTFTYNLWNNDYNEFRDEFKKNLDFNITLDYDVVDSKVVIHNFLEEDDLTADSIKTYKVKGLYFDNETTSTNIPYKIGQLKSFSNLKKLKSGESSGNITIECFPVVELKFPKTCKEKNCNVGVSINGEFKTFATDDEGKMTVSFPNNNTDSGEVVVKTLDYEYYNSTDKRTVEKTISLDGTASGCTTSSNGTDKTMDCEL